VVISSVFAFTFSSTFF